MEDEILRKLNYASDEADAKLTFFIHVSMYLAVNALLIAVNLHGASHHFWAKWPIIIWGFILLLHVVKVLRSPHQKQRKRPLDVIEK